MIDLFESAFLSSIRECRQIGYTRMIELVRFEYHERMVNTGLDQETAAQAIGIPLNEITSFLEEKDTFIRNHKKPTMTIKNGQAFEQTTII